MNESDGGRVVFQPSVYRRFGAGARMLVDTVRPTLGPQPRIVMLSPNFREQKPELLDDAGTIARRVVQLTGRDEDMGAMFVRHMLWRVKEQAGDGTATAAVLFQSLYEQGVRYLAAGGNAPQLRRHLERGLQLVLDQLSAMTLRSKGEAELSQLAEAVCHEPELAHLLGEIFDIIGCYGRLELRAGHGLGHRREYTEGLYYERSGVLAASMLADAARQRTDLHDAGLIISDLDVTDVHDLVPAIVLAQRMGLKALAIMLTRLTDDAIPLLLSATRGPDMPQVIAVKAPGVDINDRSAALEELRYTTGGRPLLQAAGDSLRGVAADDIGRARRIWATGELFGLVGGQGDTRKLRGHIAALSGAFERADDPVVRKRLLGRLGKLRGGSAALFVGGLSSHDIDARKELAERTAQALRGALREGVVPGGGTALLNCRAPLLQIAADSLDETERFAYRMLARALEEPFRTIVANAGHNSSVVLAALDQAPAGSVWDARSDELADAAAAGIFDVASVQKAAAYHAIGGAALALTIDVLVHSKRQIVSINP